MNPTVADEAIELGRVVSSALAAAGGAQIARDVEAAPDARHERVASVLDPLGVWDLLPREDALEREAAAEVCRAAGRVALPYPVAERLARIDDGAAGLVLVGGHAPRANLADVPLAFTAATMDRRVGPLRVTSERLGSKLGAFVVDVELGPLSPVADDVAALAVVLAGWTLLGTLERALELTRQHVREREQFGRRLADFQGVQFQLTDAAVAVQGLDELAKYTLWAQSRDQQHRLVDAIAFRAAALDAASVVFRVAHQLHGATGFCDEHDLSWLSRGSQPLRRLPLNATETDLLLLELVENRGLSGLFSPSSASYSRSTRSADLVR